MLQIQYMIIIKQVSPPSYAQAIGHQNQQETPQSSASLIGDLIDLDS